MTDFCLNLDGTSEDLSLRAGLQFSYTSHRTDLEDIFSSLMGRKPDFARHDWATGQHILSWYMDLSELEESKARISEFLSARCSPTAPHSAAAH